MLKFLLVLSFKMSSCVKMKEGMIVSLLFFLSVQVFGLLKMCVANVILAKICQRGRFLGL